VHAERPRRKLRPLRLGTGIAALERLPDRQHAAGVESRCTAARDAPAHPQPGPGHQRGLGPLVEEQKRDGVPPPAVAVGRARILARHRGLQTDLRRTSQTEE